MGILRRIERRLEGIFAGGFGRTFHSHVQPIELARKLAKEMDDHRRISVQRVYVPNVYRVFLSPGDREQFATYEASLRAELAGYLAEHARREGYAMVTRPKVFLETADELDAGTFGIAVSIEEPSNPPGAAGRAPGSSSPGLPPEFADGSAPLPPGVRAPAGPPPTPPVIPQALREPAVPPAAVPDLPDVPAEVEPPAAADAPEQPDAPAPADAAALPVEPPAPDEAPSGDEAPSVDAPPAGDEAPAVEVEPAPVAAPALAVAEAPVAASDVAAEPALEPATELAAPLPEPPTPAGVPPTIERFELVWPGGRVGIERRALVLGRSRECDVVITDGNVSRRHAELVRDAGGFVVRDLDSTNGVLVNGRRVREARVGPGDAIVVGLTTLRLERTRM